MAWDKDKPAGSQKIRLSDEEIRNNWAALEDTLAREHTFPGTMGGTAGQHTPLIANLQKQFYNAATAAGTVDAITATFAPALAALVNNLMVCVVAAGANTAVAPTFAPDGLVAKSIVKGANQALVPGDIPGAGYPMFLVYNSTYTAWVLINPVFPFPALVNKFALLQNRQAQNNHGGSTTSGSWGIVPLNTEQEDPDGIVDATSLPAFTLAPGTYRIEAMTPFEYEGSGSIGAYPIQTRLYNVTDAAVSIVGHCGGALDFGLSYLLGTITITTDKQFRLEYQVATSQATTGHGKACGFGTEVYAQLTINKIG